MSNFYKNMKFPNLEKGKLLTLDEEGVLIASDTNIAEIIDETKLATELNPLNDRVTALETSMGDVQSRLENINGETV